MSKYQAVSFRNRHTYALDRSEYYEHDGLYAHSAYDTHDSQDNATEDEDRLWMEYIGQATPNKLEGCKSECICRNSP